MKRNFRILALLLAAMVAPLSAAAQTAPEYSATSPEFDFRGRFSAEVDKKIIKGLHVSLSEELRVKDNWGAIDRMYTTLGVSYKVCPYFRVGAGYTFINIWHEPNKRHPSKYWDLRHRATVDLTGIYKTGAWHLSLRERVQTTTEREKGNRYQEPRTEVVLRSRFKVSYECRTVPIEPYVFCEVRNTLNAVKYDSDLKNISYSDVYVNRVRASLGVEWRIDRGNRLDFYGQFDYTRNKDIDAKKDGTLKKITTETGYYFTLGVAYKFGF